MSKILVIDDSQSIIDMMGDFLSAEGHEVLTAENGNTGIQMIKKYRPSLVVTDIIMPEKDGVEVTLFLRMNYPEIKLVVMSAGGAIPAEQHLLHMSQLGAEHMLVKPFSKSDMLSAVNKALNFNPA